MKINLDPKREFAEKPRTKIGDTRQITRFLWLPKIAGKELRWLEKAAIYQVFQIYTVRVSSLVGRLVGRWFTTGWANP